jgi:hypothetical protein
MSKVAAISPALAAQESETPSWAYGAKAINKAQGEVPGC